MPISRISDTSSISLGGLVRHLPQGDVTVETVSALFAELDVSAGELEKEALGRYHAVQQRIRGARRELNALLRRCRPGSGALYQVPPEIWAIIFKSACSSYLSTSRAGIRYNVDILNPKNPLLVISRVCTLWKDTIELLPELWTSISLKDCWNVPRTAKKDILSFVTERFQLLADVLRYSGDHPLHISISSLHSDPCSAPLVYHAVNTLAKHSRRWATLDIDDCGHQLATRALASSISLLAIDNFPLLAHLTYEWNGADKSRLDLASQEVYFPSIGATPMLRSLELRLVAPPTYSLQWSLLEKVVLHYIEVEHSRDVIPHLVSVVDLDISWNTAWDDLNDFPILEEVVDFVLPEVQRLILNSWDTHFFAFMKAPRLRDLTISLIQSDGVRAVAEFITRSQCLITTFMIDETFQPRFAGDNPSPFQTLLISMPALRSFEVSCSQNYNPVIEDGGIGTISEPLGLHDDNRVMSCCPRLEDLTIWFDGTYTPSSARTFVDMLQARWNASKSTGSGLRVATVDVSRDLGRPEFADGSVGALLKQRLELMMDEGLQLSLAR